MLLRYILIILVYTACICAPYFPGFPHEETAYGNAYAAVFLGTLLIISLLLLPERKIKRQAAASFGESLVWAFCGIFILFVLQIAAVIVNSAIMGQPLQSKHTQEVVSMTRSAPVFIFTVSLIGPILEEIVFRKILFGTMRGKIGFFFAALISSLLFSFFHFDFNHLLVYLTIGFFLCYVYHKTGRIWSTMFMHAAMNAIVLVTSLTQ